MKLIIFVVLYCIVSQTAASITADCKFENFGAFKIGTIYQCTIQSPLNITNIDSRTIDNVTGIHAANKTDNDVISFYSKGNNVHYFPQGIEKLFKNLRRIFVEQGRLKEIKQADLKPFTELEELVLGNNDIEVLEDGLFEFNPKLKFISFYHTKIFHIDQNVFSNLKNLTHLWMEGNKCVSEQTHSSSATQALITKVKDKCHNLDYVEVRKNIGELEKEIETISLENYKILIDKLEKSENKFKNSYFSHYLIFEDKLKTIKNDQKYLNFLKFHTLDKQLENSNLGRLETLKSFLKSLIRTVLTLNQNVDKIDNIVTNSESEIKKRVASVESSLGGIENKTSLIVDQKIQAFRDTLKGFEPDNVKNIKTDVASLKADLGKLNDFEVRMDNRTQIVEKAIKDFDVKLDQKLDKIKKEFKDSEAQTNAKLDQKSADIAKCNKFKNESVLLFNSKFEENSMKIGVVEGKLKEFDDKYSKMPQIDPSESILELNDTVEYIQESLTSFKNEIRTNLDKHENDVNTKTFSVLSKIDVLVKRIVELENEVKILKGK